MGTISHSDYLMSKKWILPKSLTPHRCLAIFACPSRRMTVGKFMKLQNKKPSPAMKNSETDSICKLLMYFSHFQFKNRLAFCAFADFHPFFWGSHWWSLSCFSPWPGNECLVAEILLLISTPSAQVQWGIPTAGFSKNLFLILIVFFMNFISY